MRNRAPLGMLAVLLSLPLSAQEFSTEAEPAANAQPLANPKSAASAELALDPEPVMGAGRAGKSEPAAEAEALRAQRRALSRELRAIMEAHRDRSPAEQSAALQAWREANRARSEELRQRERALAEKRERPALTPAQIEARFERPAPAGLEGDELALWHKRQALAKSRFALTQSQREQTPPQRQASLEQWRQENQALITQLEALRASVAAQRVARPLPPVSPPRIPAGASAEQRAELETRHAVRVLQRERSELLRSLREAPPEARAEALRQWEATKGLQLEAKRRQLSTRPVHSSSPGEAPRSPSP